MNEKNKDLIKLTKWDKYFEFPTKGSMRNLWAKRSENGSNFWVMITGSVYIDMKKFNEWKEHQGAV